MKNKLKPCPFCGDKSVILINPKNDWRYAECLRCRGRGPERYNHDSALAAWNQRVEDEKLLLT
ncbi:restriction alleviation protein, Lar family [Xenorhabdus sp. DI]|nr:restriction alleviation protein, Lar family [Xenorhabdus sp. 3]MBD2788426.1 restriction alleviation protein, Lar family [Xenorhabdus sp. DI]MBD2798329.1 restriction alleviation protein, Lar family [Xenorhabdus sp. 18]